MKNKINVVEILKNCPKGMELYSPIFGKVYLDEIRPHLAIVVTIDKEQSDIKEEFLYDGRYGINGECMLFPSKDKASWEGFMPPCKFKDGDIVATRTSHYSWISIYKENRKEFNEDACYTYVDYEKDRKDFYVNDLSRCLVFDREIITQRLATEEEKKRLLQAIKDNGYKWDAERKCLIELPKFKNGDILAVGDWVFIFKELHTNGSPRCYCHYDLTLEEFKVDTNSYMACGGDIYLATKEQQDLLFSKMEGAGYKWNAETKTLDRLISPRFKVGDKVSPLCNNNQYIITELTDTHYTLVEVTKKFLYTEPIEEDKNWELVPDKFDINTLKPFDKVLARDSIIDKWHIQFFDRFDGTHSFPFFCVGNVYNQCIPYKDNEHLRGTADDCDEFYKTWED